MAELAGVGVASCILQVIDFSAKVIKTTYVLITASQDALREEIHLTKLVQEQDAIAHRLHVSISSRPRLSANEKTVVDLASDIRREAHEILKLLGQFKAASIGHSRFKRTVHCTKTAMRILGKKGEVEARRNKLRLVNDQLATALMSVVRYDNVCTLSAFPTVLIVHGREQNEQINMDIRVIQRTPEGDTKDILAAIKSARNDLAKLFDLYERKRQKCLWNVITSLGFSQMQARQQSIPNAHHGTYDWALTKDINGLATWLRMGSDTFWIAGKAGSGKSTFMKFLSNDQRTYKFLSEWSGDQASLIVVNCYFWFLGSSLQKSIEGLIRTILYQILSENPGVVELLFSARWAREKDGSSDPHTFWTMEELRDALGNVGNLISGTIPGALPRKICLFIDGLDEYSGDHGELIHTLRSFVKDRNTKLCVSSRPWNVFANAFGNTTPHLFLHEVTEGDIRLFVESSLRSGMASPSAFQSRDSSDQHLVSLANDIITRAEGVFLWVHLVVRSVKRGLQEGDEIMILRERVLELPTDLESFFETILDRVDSVYRHQTAQALTLAYLYAEGHDAATPHSSYLDFELLLRHHAGLQDTHYLWTLKPHKMNCDQLMQTARRTQEKLSASCKDLLLLVIPKSFSEVHAYAEDPSRLKVQFLHRTVFEYLKSSGRIRELQRNVPSCFHDESVFHLLNMGKLKLAWDRQPEARSDYFLRQVSFSLDRGWPGLDVRFIDQLQQCQDLHQSDLCASIAAAYIAFEQFDVFRSIFTSTSSQHLITRFGPDKRRFAIKLKKSAQKSWDLQPVLAASLGLSTCRTFHSDNIDTLTLASILHTISEAASEQIVMAFLNSALSPLMQACELASTNPESWNEFFQTNTMHHMYDVTQTLMYSGHASSHMLLSLQWPVLCNRFRDTIWTYLTARSEAWERKCGLIGPHNTSLDSCGIDVQNLA